MTVARFAPSRTADLLDPPRTGAVTLGQVVRDQQLLAADIPWWPAQLELFDSLDGPEELHVWAIGRQAGKTSMAAAAALHNALWRPDLDQLLPRSRVRYVLIAGAGRDQSHEVIRVIRGLLDQTPGPLPIRSIVPLAGRIDFELHTGRQVCIRAMPTWGRSVRGLTASLAILDEFAHVAQTEGPGADHAVYAGLTPALRRFGRQAKKLVISTPGGRAGKFFELFEQIEAGLHPSAKAWQAAVWEIDPNIDQQWLDAQKAELGDALFAQEYGASFVEGAAAFFADLANIDWAPAPAAPTDATHWIVALDPAFHADGFGYAALGPSRTAPGRLLVGAVGAIKPEGDAHTFDARRGREDQTLALVHEQVAAYAPTRIVTDQHQAAPISAYFERRGIPVETVNITGPLRTSAFVQLRARLSDGSVHCPRDPLLSDELRRVRAKTGSTGVHLPRHGDSHCDAAMALALGVWAAEQDGGPAVGAAGPRGSAYRTDRYGRSEFA